MSVYHIYMLYIHFMIRNVHLIYTQCTRHNNISLFLWQMTTIAHVHTHTWNLNTREKNSKFRSFFFRSWNTHSRQIIKKIRMHAHTPLFLFFCTFSIQVKPNGKITDKKQFKEFFNLIFHTCTEAKNDDDVDCRKIYCWFSSGVICCLYLCVSLCCMETSFSHSLHSCM